MVSRQENNRPRSSIFEIGVSIILLLLVLFVAAPLFERMMQNFEKTAVKQLVSQLNSAAQFKLAEYVALDKLKSLPKQISGNPIAWLDAEDIIGWDGYLGEVVRVDFNQLTAQSWQYDQTTRRLIYKVEYIDGLNNDDPIKDRIQYRFVLDFVDYDNDGVFDDDVDTISGLRVEAVYPYQWVQG